MDKARRPVLKLLFVLVAAILALPVAIEALDQPGELEQSVEAWCSASECGLSGSIVRRELLTKRERERPPPSPLPKDKSPLIRIKSHLSPPPKSRPPPLNSPPPNPPNSPPPPTLNSPPPPTLNSPPPPTLNSPPPPPPPSTYPSASVCPFPGTAVYPPQNPAPWSKFYKNNWTPSNPPGGLVVSADEYHVDLQIQSQNEIFGGFLSQNRFLHGYFSMWMKLIPNNSAGLAMTYYLTSPENNTVDAQGNSVDTHDELDFEFLGNVTGEPIVLQTNMYLNGHGNREIRHALPFDPTADFHKYSLLWNKDIIIWYIDDSVIRVHHNKSDVPFPTWRPMAVEATLWNASSWATRGGLVQLNLSYAPFKLQYEGFDGVDGCVACPATQSFSDPDPACPMAPNASYVAQCSTPGNGTWSQQSELTPAQWDELSCQLQNYVIYDYCYDQPRFTKSGVVTMPPECKYNEPNYTLS